MKQIIDELIFSDVESQVKCLEKLKNENLSLLHRIVIYIENLKEDKKKELEELRVFDFDERDLEEDEILHIIDMIDSANWQIYQIAYEKEMSVI